MKIVTDAGYHGFVGIEYEGSRLSEPEGIIGHQETARIAAGEHISGGRLRRIGRCIRPSRWKWFRRDSPRPNHCVDDFGRIGRRSHGKCPVHIVIGRRRGIAGNRRVVDDCRSTRIEVEPAANSGSRVARGPEMAGESGASRAARAAAGAGLSDAQVASTTHRRRACGIGGDDVGGLKLFGSLLRLIGG